MTPQPTTAYDLKCSPREIVALSLLLGVCLVALSARRAARPNAIGGDIPVYTAHVRAAAEKINPNTANAASLRRLPNIGPKRAAAIAAYSRQHAPAPFRRAEDLTAVRGIGPETVRRIRPLLALPASDAPPAAGH